MRPGPLHSAAFCLCGSAPVAGPVVAPVVGGVVIGRVPPGGVDIARAVIGEAVGRDGVRIRQEEDVLPVVIAQVAVRRVKLRIVKFCIEVRVAVAIEHALVRAVRRVRVAGLEKQRKAVAVGAHGEVAAAVEEEVHAQPVTAVADRAAGHAVGRVGQILHAVSVDDERLAQRVLPDAVERGQLGRVHVAFAGAEARAVEPRAVGRAVLPQEKAVAVGLKIVVKPIVFDHGPVVHDLERAEAHPAVPRPVVVGARVGVDDELVAVVVHPAAGQLLHGHGGEVGQVGVVIVVRAAAGGQTQRQQQGQQQRWELFERFLHAVLLIRSADTEKQAVVRIDRGAVENVRLGADAVELVALAGVAVIVGLRLGGKDQTVIPLGQVDDVALGEHVVPVAGLFPARGVEKFDLVGLAVPRDGVDVVVVPALGVVVGGRGREPHAGVVVVQLAAGHGDELGRERRHGFVRDVAVGVKLDLAHTVVRLVAGLGHFPVDIAHGIAVAGAVIAAHAVGQHVGAAVHARVDVQIVRLEIRRAARDARERGFKFEARVVVPEPDQLGRAAVAMVEDHGHVALAVAVQIVERRAAVGGQRVGECHGKLYAVEPDLLVLIVVEAGVFRAQADAHGHALAVSGDRAVVVHDAGGTPVVAGRVLAAGGKAQHQRGGQHQRQTFAQMFHAFPLFLAGGRPGVVSPQLCSAMVRSSSWLSSTLPKRTKMPLVTALRQISGSESGWNRSLSR